jgi:hypothetical protein
MMCEMSWLQFGPAWFVGCAALCAGTLRIMQRHCDNYIADLERREKEFTKMADETIAKITGTGT